MRQEYFAIPTPGLALRGSPQANRSAAQQQRVGQHRKIARDRVSPQILPFFHGEHLVGGVIGRQNHALPSRVRMRPDCFQPGPLTAPRLPAQVLLFPELA